MYVIHSSLSLSLSLSLYATENLFLPWNAPRYVLPPHAMRYTLLTRPSL